MDDLLPALVERLHDPSIAASAIIPWSCPVPSFGDLPSAVVATLGLNPSNREFVDGNGHELDGPDRRLHTLRSLGINGWPAATRRHLGLIAASCREYFTRNPYNGWFRSLDQIISGTRASYYNSHNRACHLDLIPYATTCKWTELTSRQRTGLLSFAGDTLGHLLAESSVRVLILNGRTVIENLERVAGITFDQELMPAWTLPRRAGPGVAGRAYRGIISELSAVKLPRPLLVLGFNHNIQSSYGVTAAVKLAIREWVTKEALGVV